jgi:hypothetical protein
MASLAAEDRSAFVEMVQTMAGLSAAQKASFEQAVEGTGAESRTALMTAMGGMTANQKVAFLETTRGLDVHALKAMQAAMGGMTAGNRIAFAKSMKGLDAVAITAQEQAAGYFDPVPSSAPTLSPTTPLTSSPTATPTTSAWFYNHSHRAPNTTTAPKPTSPQDPKAPPIIAVRHKYTTVHNADGRVPEPQKNAKQVIQGLRGKRQAEKSKAKARRQVQAQAQPTVHLTARSPTDARTKPPSPGSAPKDPALAKFMQEGSQSGFDTPPRLTMQGALRHCTSFCYDNPMIKSSTNLPCAVASHYGDTLVMDVLGFWRGKALARPWRSHGAAGAEKHVFARFGKVQRHGFTPLCVHRALALAHPLARSVEIHCALQRRCESPTDRNCFSSAVCHHAPTAHMQTNPLIATTGAGKMIQGVDVSLTGAARIGCCGDVCVYAEAARHAFYVSHRAAHFV